MTIHSKLSFRPETLLFLQKVTDLVSKKGGYLDTWKRGGTGVRALCLCCGTYAQVKILKREIKQLPVCCENRDVVTLENCYVTHVRRSSVEGRVRRYINPKGKL